MARVEQKVKMEARQESEEEKRQLQDQMEQEMAQLQTHLRIFQKVGGDEGWEDLDCEGECLNGSGTEGKESGSEGNLRGKKEKRIDIRSVKNEIKDARRY